MKNKLISSQNLGRNIYKAIIELIPENEIETIALRNAENAEASEQERQLIDNYLIFDLNNFGNYSFITLTNQEHNFFTIEVLVN